MVADLKYFDGFAVAHRPRARETCATSTPPRSKSNRRGWWKPPARRQKWIDQAQSLNIYMAGASGKKLDETYKLAWLRGLKTTYYLRTLGATHAEKSTVRAAAERRVVGQRRRRACAHWRPPPPPRAMLKPSAIYRHAPCGAAIRQCEACQ